MTLPHIIAAELRKVATLPAALLATAVATLGSLGLTLLNAVGVRNAIDSGRLETVAYTSPVEAVFSSVPIGTVGAVILGVIAISSEYTAESADAGGGRQIITTLTATPRRVAVLVAKALSVVLLVLGAGAVILPACLAVAHLVVGDASTEHTDLADTVLRSVGVTLYWALTALLALAITVLVRGGVIPLVVLIANSSLVSVSLLLLKVTPVARFLPDLAGIGMFERDPFVIDGLLDARTGGLVMAAWAIVLLGVSAVAFTHRDA